MKTTPKILTAIALGLLTSAGLLLNSGCLPMVIMDSIDRKNFGEQNIEREKAGLRPLTWQEYHYHGMHSP